MEAIAGSDANAMRRTMLLFAETVLRPVIRIALRYGLAYSEFNQIARKLYVDIAMKEPEFRGVRRKRQYKSRVACLTGLSRKEVLRLVDAERVSESVGLRSANRAARVLEGWTTDARYMDMNGKPLPLPFRAPSGRRSFSELVHDYSGDIPPRAVLEELCRAGSCTAENDMDIRVVAVPYVARLIDIDVMTSVALRISSALAAADNALSVDNDVPRQIGARMQASA